MGISPEDLGIGKIYIFECQRLWIWNRWIACVIHERKDTQLPMGVRIDGGELR